MPSENDNLFTFIEDVCHTSHLRVEADLGDGFVRLRSDEAERRQAAHDIRCTEDIVIESLRNSRDADARNIYIAMSLSDDVRKLVFIDDGTGVPSALHSLIFEPRVTSKLDTVHMDKWGIHGRGMALYSVAMNTERAEVVNSDKGLGCAIVTESLLSKLHEKSDQSTFPTIQLSDDNHAVMRGPHNIARTASEFALEHRKSLSVFLGSPAEVASTLYWRGCDITSASLRSFTHDLSGIPLVNRPCYAHDERELARICGSMGLEMSERTARRIMDGQVVRLDSLYEMLERRLVPSGASAPADNKVKKPRKSSGQERQDVHVANPRITGGELREFAQKVSEAYAPLAEAYYLDSNVDVDARVSGGVMHISIPLVQSE